MKLITMLLSGTTRPFSSPYPTSSTLTAKSAWRPMKTIWTTFRIVLRIRNEPKYRTVHSLRLTCYLKSLIIRKSGSIIGNQSPSSSFPWRVWLEFLSSASLPSPRTTSPLCHLATLSRSPLQSVRDSFWWSHQPHLNSKQPSSRWLPSNNLTRQVASISNKEWYNWKWFNRVTLTVIICWWCLSRMWSEYHLKPRNNQCQMQ